MCTALKAGNKLLKPSTQDGTACPNDVPDMINPIFHELCYDSIYEKYHEAACYARSRYSRWHLG